MAARLTNPGKLISEVVPAIQQIVGAIGKSGADPKVLEYVHMRVSQINGCAFCIEGAIPHAKAHGVTEEQLIALPGWRESEKVSDAERAAIALAESATRITDRGDVSDEIWDAAKRHFDDKSLAAIVLMIAMTNFFNRVNVTTRQVPSGW